MERENSLSEYFYKSRFGNGIQIIIEIIKKQINIMNMSLRILYFYGIIYKMYF